MQGAGHRQPGGKFAFLFEGKNSPLFPKCQNSDQSTRSHPLRCRRKVDERLLGQVLHPRSFPEPCGSQPKQTQFDHGSNKPAYGNFYSVRKPPGCRAHSNGVLPNMKRQNRQHRSPFVPSLRDDFCGLGATGESSGLPSGLERGAQFAAGPIGRLPNFCLSRLWLRQLPIQTLKQNGPQTGSQLNGSNFSPFVKWVGDVKSRFHTSKYFHKDINMSNLQGELFDRPGHQSFENVVGGFSCLSQTGKRNFDRIYKMNRMGECGGLGFQVACCLPLLPPRSPKARIAAGAAVGPVYGGRDGFPACFDLPTLWRSGAGD